MSWNDEKPHNMTGDEYMAKRCLELEQENKELKEKLEDNKTFQWILWNKTPNAKYIMELKDGKLSIEQVEEENK